MRPLTGMGDRSACRVALAGRDAHYVAQHIIPICVCPAARLIPGLRSGSADRRSGIMTGERSPPPDAAEVEPMPIHDWTRVNAGTFHDFHHEWISTIKRVLNSGLLPPDYYAMAEQIAGGREPDDLALESVRPQPARAGGNGSANAGGAGHGVVALATAPPRVRFTATAEAEQYARKCKAVTIRHASGD